VNRLTGKVCFVTGAAQGIGNAIVRHFLAEGATVIGADLRFVDELAAPLHERRILDATNAAAVRAAAAAHPDVSVLVNCVGHVSQGALLDCTLDEFDRTMRVNVRSMVLTIGAFLPAMLARTRGDIINIASVASTVMGVPQRFAYATSKAAVLGLTMSVARDYVSQGIRCNSISPGTVDTPSLHERLAATGDAAAARATFIARQPMGRLGTADEVAATAVMLASDEVLFMTGSNIIVDGGMSL